MEIVIDKISKYEGVWISKEKMLIHRAIFIVFLLYLFAIPNIYVLCK